MTRPPSGSRRAASGDRPEDALLTPYVREIRCYPLLGADEERRLALRVRAGDAQGSKRTSVRTFRFVVFEARRHVRMDCRIPLSLDADLGDEGRTTLGETVADTRVPQPEDAIGSEELSQSIQALRKLEAGDAEILGLSVQQVDRYGDRALERLRRTAIGSSANGSASPTSSAMRSPRVAP